MLSCHERQPLSPGVAASAPTQSQPNGSVVKTIMTKHIYASGNGGRIIFPLLNLVKQEVYPAKAETRRAEAVAAEARGENTVETDHIREETCSLLCGYNTVELASRAC